jgi:hypothetical protein
LKQDGESINRNPGKADMKEDDPALLFAFALTTSSEGTKLKSRK